MTSSNGVERTKISISPCPHCGRTVQDVPFMPGPGGKPCCMDCALNFEPRMRSASGDLNIINHGINN